MVKMMQHRTHDLTAAVLANNSLRINAYMKSSWLVACEFNRYTAILTLRLIILTAGSLIIVFT